MYRLLMVILFLGVVSVVSSQPRNLNAVKITQSIRIDGRMDDAAWQQAPVANDFIQNFPTFGQPATKPSTVKILYDNSAIYVAAFMKDHPDSIRKQLTPRDGHQQQDVDFFAVFFDTYNDLQNGFMFLVTSVNVQSDAKLNENSSATYNQFGDDSWDAVWESKTQITDEGWVVEMRIPYISLRFGKQQIQTWGIQFTRFSRGNNESAYWNPVDPNINGFANQFGKLKDIKDVQPPLRLSFSPYVSMGYRHNPEGSHTTSEFLRNGGMDVKYGLNESFTLDATLIPDFGQVISDNIINNLSPFEIQFTENRPFFTEGTELFNKAGLFYSRRVGAIPGGYEKTESFLDDNPNYELVKNPSVTQLYNAIKFSGRNSKKTGIGVFNAITAPMNARLRNKNTGLDSMIQTEVLTNYNVFVIDQALKGRSSVTFTNTNVMRSGHEADANVSALDWSLFTAGNKFRIKGTGRYSRIFGYTPFTGGINLVYDTISLNGEVYVKPYGGYNTSLQFAKVNGIIQYNVGGNITSHTYDPNDLGYLQAPNQVNYGGGISYNQFTPVGKFLVYKYSLNANLKYLYKPYRYSETEISASAFYYFKNFWDVTFSVRAFPGWQSDFFELRTPGKYVKKPAEITFDISGSTDSRKRLFVEYSIAYAPRAIKNNDYYTYELEARYRFSNQFSLTAQFVKQNENNQIGYAFERETNGEPILGYRDFSETVGLVSGIYNFTSRLNITMRARHYWNKVTYNSFYNVNENGYHVPRAGFISGKDENYNAFNLDAFLTWDFRLGSRVILGWKNWLGNSYAINGIDNYNYLRNLRKMFGVSHGNELTLRFIYFLDYNQLVKKK